MKYKVSKSFSCAHFYRQPQWSEEKNLREFGKCFNPYGHGHDYRAEITFSTEDVDDVLQVIESQIQRLDHHHLNFEIDEFRTQIPTTENLGLYLQRTLTEELEKAGVKAQILELQLQETPEIWVEISS